MVSELIVESWPDSDVSEGEAGSLMDTNSHESEGCGAGCSMLDA